jgi:hypothetical protein
MVGELGRFYDVTATSVESKNGEFCIPRMKQNHLILVAPKINVQGTRFDVLNLSQWLQRVQIPNKDTGVACT